MEQSVNIRSVSGALQLPASKSMMQRVCAAALLHNGATTIHNYGVSEDDEAALSIIQQLGATLEISEGSLFVQSNGTLRNAGKLNCGESGLSARLFTPIAALSEHAVRIEGSGSLPHRPMHPLGDMLPQLGVELQDFNGFIPFTLQGPLRAADISVDGSMSSQFLTGLLFAYTAAATGPVSIAVQRLTSKPYIDLSLEVLKLFGKPVAQDNYERFLIDPALFELRGQVDVTVEADWSSAAFWIAAAAISGSILLHGLNRRSTQADIRILNVLDQCGAVVAWEGSGLRVQHHSLHAFTLDSTDCPDLFPVVSILAACCTGTSQITGLHRLAHKESNRVESICALLQALRVSYSITGDTLQITGQSVLHGAAIDSFRDHRIVMAAALASLRADGPMAIRHASAVKKSYPDFFSDLLKHAQ